MPPQNPTELKPDLTSSSKTCLPVSVAVTGFVDPGQAPREYQDAFLKEAGTEAAHSSNLLRKSALKNLNAQIQVVRVQTQSMPILVLLTEALKKENLRIKVSGPL